LKPASTAQSSRTRFRGGTAVIEEDQSEKRAEVPRVNAKALGSMERKFKHSQLRPPFSRPDLSTL